MCITPIMCAGRGVVGNCSYASMRRKFCQELERGLVLVTTRVACDYFNELYAFDEVSVRMRAGPVTQSRVTMLFEYWRVTPAGEELIARGEQQIACLRKEGEQHVPTPVPAVLRQALAQYVE